jgi:hypothetical protein
MIPANMMIAVVALTRAATAVNPKAVAKDALPRIRTRRSVRFVFDIL